MSTSVSARTTLRLGQAESQWHDALRLFLILQVVLGHLAAIALPPVSELVTDVAAHWPFIGYRMVWRFGSQAAFLFVFLSGFMVAGPLFFSLRGGSIPSARDFFVKRLRRIAPIAVGAVLLTALLDWLALLAPGAEALYRESYAYDMVASTTWANFVGNLLFLQPVFVDSFGSNGPLWTLGYIVQYYVLGWVLCRACNADWRIGGLTFVAMVLGMAVLRPEWAILFLSWLAGGIARQFRLPRQLGAPLLALGLLLFVGSNLVDPLWSAALSIPVGIFVTQGLIHVRMHSRAPTRRLRTLSNDSYVIYAVHHTVLMAVFVGLFRGEVGPNETFIVLLVASVPAVLVVSVLLKTLVNALVEGRGQRCILGRTGL